jgi:hypothetical protein
MKWYELDCSDSGCEQVKGFSEHGNEPSGFINVGKFVSNCTTGGFSRRLRSMKFVSSHSFMDFVEIR